MGCGASTQLKARKYAPGPIETPFGEIPAEPRRSKPFPLLAPLDVGGETTELATESRRLSKEIPTDGADAPVPPVDPAEARAIHSGSEETVAPPPLRENSQPSPPPTHAIGAPAAGAPPPPTETPPAWKTHVPPPRRRDTPPVLPPVKIRATSLPPIGTVSGPKTLVRPGVHPTLHAGVESLVERQSGVTTEMQGKLRTVEKDVKGHSNALRRLWRDIGLARVNACAIEARLIAVLQAQLPAGELRDRFEKQNAQMDAFKAEMGVETEKSNRWLTLARGLQGKLDTLVLEGLIEAVSPAGILFSPHFRRDLMDTESELSARSGMPHMAPMGMGIA